MARSRKLTWPESRKLTWPESRKRTVRHLPDLFCQMLEGQVVVTDCRPASRADEKFRRKAAVTSAACSHIGMDYRLVGEPNPVWAANLRWLVGCWPTQAWTATCS